MNILIKIRQIFTTLCGETNPVYQAPLGSHTHIPLKQIMEKSGGVGGGKAVIYENTVHHNFAIFLQ